jgi:hypothetical protein
MVRASRCRKLVAEGQISANRSRDRSSKDTRGYQGLLLKQAFSTSADLVQQAQATINSMNQSSYWGPLKTPIMRLYVVGQEYFLNTPPAHLAPVGLIGVMGTVFLAWKVKRWEPFMRKWWLHRPVILGSGAVRQWQNSVTLFTSTVSILSGGEFNLLTTSAFPPIPASLRLQLLRALFVRCGSLLFHRHSTSIDGTSNPQLDAHAALPRIPSSRGSSIVPLVAPMDQPRPAPKTHPDTLISRSHILGSSTSGSSGDITQSRS